MQKLKILLTDGATVFIPESNLSKFQQIHFGEVVSVTEPDEDGNYPEESFATSSTGAAIDGYRKENESLSEENERLIDLKDLIISENEKLTQSNSDQAFEINRLSDVNENLSTENQRLASENTDLKTEIASLNFTIEKLSNPAKENITPGAEPTKGKPGPKPKAVNPA